MKDEAEASGHSFTEQSPCPYFGDGRTATIEYIPGGDAGPEEFGRLLSRGYRRLGSIFYRNRCASCAACRPLRVEVERFVPSRSQRRTMRRNGDILTRCFSPAVVTEEKIALYRNYLRSKHGNRDPDDDDASHLTYLHYGFGQTIEMDYYLGERLVGVGIVDAAGDGLSSNYFYYDTDVPERRLGVFSILLEIRLARRLGKKHLYLGFCIEETEKMAYKKFFRPNQVLEGGIWRPFLD